MPMKTLSWIYLQTKYYCIIIFFNFNILKKVNDINIV